ncbi:MAG: hypothetical protein MUO76_03195, partial [Anaerolineaceae bacterium]|nr:hypothetical protein [Anaerolineaceae bacterium]
MLKKKAFWILLAVIVSLGIAGYAYYNLYYTVEEVQTETPIQTSRVRRGDIVVSATGMGSVIPAQEISVGFQNSGILTDLYV